MHAASIQGLIQVTDVTVYNVRVIIVCIYIIIHACMQTV